jgi:hypothetical protein
MLNEIVGVFSSRELFQGGVGMDSEQKKTSTGGKCIKRIIISGKIGNIKLYNNSK